MVTIGSSKTEFVHILICVCVHICVFVAVWALPRCVFLCVSAVRRIVAPLAADEALCFKSRLLTQCRATLTAQIASLIHSADVLISHQPSLFHFWLPAIWLLFTSRAGKNTDPKAK